MTFPLYMNDFFNYPTGLFLGTLIGFGFGFALERAGFGRASVLAAQFYGGDNRVLKVMFSAIVTALLGSVVLAEAGLLDLSLMTIPATFLWPQIAGGLLLGVGFIISGYCPGTSVVAAASGKFDGVVTIVGVGIGSLVFGFAYPAVEGFFLSGAMGPVRLPELLGVSQVVVAAGVVTMAIGAFVGAEKLERVLAARRGESIPGSSILLRRRVFTGFAAATALATVALFVPAQHPVQAERPIGSIEALDLAQTLIESPTSVYVVDLRGREACTETRIPHALCLPEGDDDAGFARDLPPTRTLVVYGAGDATELPDGVRGFTGDIVVLRGGFAAFEAEVLNAPELPADPDHAAIEAFRLRSALHAHFTGAQLEAPVEIAPRKMVRAAKKKGGGC